MTKPWIIILSGLPGSGKTTLARLLAQKTGALHLRIDSIEQALIRSGIEKVGPAGYMAAYEVAKDHLNNGGCVIADSVNPIEITRRSWRMTAETCEAAVCEILIVCSDPSLHRHRLQSRKADIPGHILPAWEDVIDLIFEPWIPDIHTIDMAFMEPERAARQAVKFLESTDSFWSQADLPSRDQKG